MVEFVSDGIALRLGEAVHACAFREILPDEAVGVFIRASLPGVVRSCEEEGDAVGLLDFFVAMELAAVVGCDGLEACWALLHELPKALIGGADCPTGQSSDHDIAGLAIHNGEDASTARSHDGIDLPMADPGAILGA